MSAPWFTVGLLSTVVATTHFLGVRLFSAPDWFGMLRSVMMVLGGLVVIAIVLVVSVAVISGVIGMIGKLRQRQQ